MKLIDEYYELTEAERVSERIRRAGVMTIVTNKRSYNLSRIRTGVFKVGLWVVFDDQYEDAIHLLSNRKHNPARKVSLREMLELEETAKDEFSLAGRRFFEKIAVIVFGGMLAVLLIYVFIGMINEA